MAQSTQPTTTQMPDEDTEGRRDFLKILTVSSGGVGAVAFGWNLVNSMNPAADVRALASVEVNIGSVQPGGAITVKWRGKPVFIRRRVPDEIAAATRDDSASLPDNQTDAQRVQNPEWLVVVGICTHLGCVPLGQQITQPRGEYGGWFCPCHGSHYDTSGRIRKGPAPKNLDIPPYKFTSETTLLIG